MQRLLTLAAVTLAAACGDSGTPVAPRAAELAPPAAAPAAAAADRGPTVMTYNVYYGADFLPVLAAPLDSVPFATARVWAGVQATDFPARAGALAREIAAARPDLVGLEEAAIWRRRHPGTGEPATDVALDFVQILIDSLAARGAHYTLAAADSTTDIQLPAFAGMDGDTPVFDDLRVTDRDAVLVREGVAWTNPQHAVYAAYIPIDIGPVHTGVYEGWSSVDATFGGQRVRFVATHFEFQQALPVQLAQAEELIATLADETGRTILTGDLNSDASGRAPGAATPAYGMLADAGFRDAWAVPDRAAPGLTCCQAGDLRNGFGAFDQRVDFVLFRHFPDGPGVPVVARHVVGDRPGDRTPSGLWPSDHAGVVITFRR